MKFSIIIGTLNRPAILKECLKSISNQTYKNFEVIIIDQSANNMTEEVIAENNSCLEIMYKHIDVQGLSHARNVAIECMTGDYFCLFDDDALYDENYLLHAFEYLKKSHPKIILSGYIWDNLKKKDFINYKECRKNKPLSVRNIIRCCPSATLIIPKTTLTECGGFDERFGVGTTYSSSEETDYLLRTIKNGYSIYFLSQMIAKHPIIMRSINENEVVDNSAKSFAYSKGMGALYKKHIIYLKQYLLIIFWSERCLKILVKLCLPFKFNNKIVFSELKGIVEGFKEYM